MKKIAIAVAAAVAAATAGAADVTIYGIVDTGLGYTNINTLDAPTVNKFEMINGYNCGSRFGFKGTEDLGNGYAVSFILENGFSSDSGTLGQSGRMFGREAQVKLHTPYGTLSAGRAGTILSGAGSLDVFGTLADTLPGGWDGIFNIGNYDGNGSRLDNMVTYQTPTAAGFTGYLQYSFANDTKKGDDDSRANERTNNRFAAAGLSYVNGPVNAVVIYSSTMYKHDANPSKNVGDNRAISVGGSYDFGVLRLSAYGQYVKGARTAYMSGWGNELDFGSNVTGVVTDADGYNLHLGAKIPLPCGRLFVAGYYGKLELNDVTDNEEATNLNLMLTHEYDLSKRTIIYSGVGYRQVELEGDSKQYVEDKSTQVIVGLRHIF